MDYAGVSQTHLCLGARQYFQGAAILVFDGARGQMYCEAYGSRLYFRKENAGI